MTGTYGFDLSFHLNKPVNPYVKDKWSLYIFYSAYILFCFIAMNSTSYAVLVILYYASNWVHEIPNDFDRSCQVDSI